VVLSRKLRMPSNPEYALGAVSEMGDTYLNVPSEEMTPAFRAFLERECQDELREIARRRDMFRQGRPMAQVAGRSVIVTDDGIATGATMIAALRTLKAQKPLETMVAVPVASPDRLREVKKECDDCVCLIEAPELLAVGQYYRDFAQVEDEEVSALLQKFSRTHAVES